MTLSGRRVLLGVTGGIASYKACTLARRLTQSGATVDTVLTPAAAKFVGPVTFEALTGRPVLTSLWESGRALDHIRLARDPDLVVVAPASADFLARAALGLADDVLTAIVLARTGPILAAPAMNDMMYAHPATRQNIATLAGRGWVLVGPDAGDLAEGPSELPGRMSEPELLHAHAERLLRSGGPLTGKTVLVTAGPTREVLDAVRVITNRSSGRMGVELARAAWARGARVVLVCGPTGHPMPVGVELVRVESTEDMASAVARHLPEADLLVMAAAPADYRPAARAAGKLTRESGGSLELRATDDVLATTAPLRRSGAVVIGFALEVGDGLARAREKLERKQLDLIVLNHADEPGAGFETETNRVTLVNASSQEPLALMTKQAVAEAILDRAEALL